MCGIAGIVARQMSGPDIETCLRNLAGAMHHRGPDDMGLLVQPELGVGLAACRLAIRDLSPAGHMPMLNDQETVSIVYNGEIYNTEELRARLKDRGYAFRSHSDTEVILRGYEAWGEEVVSRLRGIFAFAILDRRAEPRLFLARDQLGVKPLYYSTGGETFAFASELSPLVASGLVTSDVDPTGLVGFLLLGSVPGPWTIRRGVRMLEPGHCMSVRLDEPSGVVDHRRYWSLPTSNSTSGDRGSAIEEVRGLVGDAVRSQLVSDVPLGAFLSGGLDSSIIATVMRAEMSGSIRTCSMVFSEAGYSEASYAQSVADAIESEHVERVVSPQDVLSELDGVLAAMDQPTIDGVNTYFVSQTARQAGLTVALSGLGADELFGGYAGTFQGVPQMRRGIQAIRSVPGVAPAASLATRHLHGRWARIHDALQRPASYASAYLTRRGLFSPSEVRALVRPDVWEEASEQLDPVRYVEEQAGEGGDSFSWISRAELSTYTANQLLRDTDVMSMAHSLEVRVPFLDHRLVETALRLPAAVKCGDRPKSLLRDAVPELPRLVTDRSEKQGFTFPFDVWLRDSMKGRVEDLVGATSGSPSMKADAVLGIWDRFQRGEVHWSRAWALAVLSGWTS